MYLLFADDDDEMESETFKKALENQRAMQIKRAKEAEERKKKASTID